MNSLEALGLALNRAAKIRSVKWCDDEYIYWTGDWWRDECGIKVDHEIIVEILADKGQYEVYETLREQAVNVYLNSDGFIGSVFAHESLKVARGYASGAKGSIKVITRGDNVVGVEWVPNNDAS